MKEKLKNVLEDAIQQAVSDTSYETNEYYFVGSVEFTVEDGWTSVEITKLKITE